MRLTEWGDRIRQSLWFVPALCTATGAALALLLIWVSGATETSGSDLPFIFAAGADGARAMLQAIAGSIITVAGVVFSITIVALQLASSQFSPRVLRSYLRDRSQQLVLGVFMGTFTYTLVVLRSIRAEDGGDEGFVPAFAITGSLLLTLVSLGMLIYFIHHISIRIQVTSIIASVADETVDAIERLARRWRPDEERSWHPATAPAPVTAPPSGSVSADAVEAADHLVPATQSGYLRLVDIEALVAAAAEHGGRLKLLAPPGAWVQKGLPCAALAVPPGSHPDLEELAERIGEAITVGRERTMNEDVAFGVQQLVDIAVKALSPSVNDPTTAVNCIDRLVQILVAAGANADDPRSFTDDEGTVRLEVPYPDFERLVDLSFDQIGHYGGTTTTVVIHLARALSMLRSLPPHRHPPLRRHARILAEAARRITVEDERRRALTALAPLLD